jgi:hypothetical protein
MLAPRTARCHGLVRRHLDVLRVPDDDRCFDILAELLIVPDGPHTHAIAQRLLIGREIVLRFHEQSAVPGLGVIEHGVDMPRGGDIGDAVADAQQRGFDVVLLVEMGNTEYRDVKLFGKLLERRKDAAHVGCRAAANLADPKVGAYGVDAGADDIADLFDCCMQPPSSGLATT